MSSRFFIERPIFASVVSIVIVVMGLLAHAKFSDCPISGNHPPVVQIEADYPGASAEVAADSVARPIEVQLPGIDNLLYYDSTSSERRSRQHQTDVRNRHQRGYRAGPDAEPSETGRAADSS